MAKLYEILDIKIRYKICGLAGYRSPPGKAQVGWMAENSFRHMVSLEINTPHLNPILLPI